MSIVAKKVLVPLTVLLAAGALAVGSGATFSSETSNTISTVTSGTLLHTNSKNGAEIFGLTNFKPGDTLNGSVTITNTGSLPATFSLTETSSANAFTGEYLKLAIKNTTSGVTVYDGTFGGLVDGTKNDLGVVAPGAANVYTFTVTLAQDAPNSEQGKTATAAYQWSSVQTAGSVTNQ
ncbi:TasA family protein [Knoellia sp. CPCC 206450]|uniref:TasA family protein n=1 Tax=Knoellia tibetensis TaxID=3404798 RepID=UPI003B4338C6